MGGHVRAICDDTAIAALGERTHEAFWECAILGLVIVRDTQSGRLYVLEVNLYRKLSGDEPTKDSCDFCRRDVT